MKNYFLTLIMLTLVFSGTAKACTGDGSSGDLTCGLIGWWQFNDGSGLTAQDSSTGGNNGTLVNSPSWVPGIVGPSSTPYALNFNGTNQAVSTGLTESGLSTFSVSAWIRTTSTAGNYVVNWGTNVSLSVYSGDGNEVAFTVNGSSWGGASASAGTKLVDGRWHHLVGTYDGTNQYLYIDNVLLAGPTASAFTVQPARMLYIGEFPYYTPVYYTGSIEDVRVYNRALSPSDVTSLFQLGVIKPTTYYVDYADGSDSNNGTSTSTPWQHAPGDVNATLIPASTGLNPGDTVIFKGGVPYLGTVKVTSSGSSVSMTLAGSSYVKGDVLNVSQNGGGSGMTITVLAVSSTTGAITSYAETTAGSGYTTNLSCVTIGGSGNGANFNYDPLPITYDGNSAGTFGTGKAIIDGQGTTLGVNARQYGFTGFAVSASPINIGQSFIVINNFEIRNLRYVFEDNTSNPPYGIYFTGFANNIEIKNCYLHDIQKAALALNTMMNRIDSPTAGETNGHLATPLTTVSVTNQLADGATSGSGTLSDTQFTFSPYVATPGQTNSNTGVAAIYKVLLGWTSDDYYTAWGYTGQLVQGNTNSINIYQDINLTKPGWNTSGFFYNPLRPLNLSGTNATSVGGVYSDGLVSSVLTDSGANFIGVASVQIYSGGSGYQIGDVLNIVQSQASGATVTVSAINPVATALIDAGGTGYKVGDVLGINQSGGSNATVTVTGVNCSGAGCSGPIQYVSLTDTGNGYTTANAVQTSGGSGQNATVNITVISGKIVGVTLNTAGTGYSTTEGLATTNASGSGLGSGATVNILQPVSPGTDYLRIISGTGVKPGDYLITANNGTTLTVLGNFGTSTAGDIVYKVVYDYFYWIYSLNGGAHMGNGLGIGIAVLGDNNVSIHDNIVQDAKTGISVSPQNDMNMDNAQIYYNDISRVGWGIAATSGGDSLENLTNPQIYGNTLHDFWNHDLYDWGWHNDGVFLFNAGGSSLSLISGLKFYDNIFYGNIAFDTANLYIEGNLSNLEIYDNIFAAQGSGYDIRTADGPGTITNISVFNNTFAKTSGASQLSMLFQSLNTTLRNNIVDLFEGYGGDFAIGPPSTDSSSSDYNLLNNSYVYSGDVGYGGAIYSLEQWTQIGSPSQIALTTTQADDLPSIHDQDDPKPLRQNASFKNSPVLAAMTSAQGCSTTGGPSGCATPGDLSRVYLLADPNMPSGYTFAAGDNVEYNFDGVPRTIQDIGTDSTGKFIDIMPALLNTSQQGDTILDWKGATNFYYDESLNTGSPAIGAGTNLSSTIGSKDANGYTRGGTWDIGAYASGTTGSVSPNVVLTINQAIGETGTGTVSSNPIGINCGYECAAAFSAASGGTTVTLTAQADSGSVFAGWSGAGCSGTSTCTVTMNTPRNVTANFASTTTAFSLNILATNGSAVESVNAQVTDVANFVSGTTVTLRATPNVNYTLSGWVVNPGTEAGEDCSGTAGTCTVTVNAVTNVTANFNASSSVLYGDVNDDGYVTLYDAEITAQKNLGLAVSSFNSTNAEVNSTGTLDMYDAFLISEYSQAIINILPIEALKIQENVRNARSFYEK